MRFRIIYVPAVFILSDKVMHRLLSSLLPHGMLNF